MKVSRDKKAVRDGRWGFMKGSAGRRRSQTWSVRFFVITILVMVVMTSMVNLDDSKFKTDPKLALESFQVADGFEVTLFAAEPMVVKPIQMNWDPQGRLWVVSSTAYPQPKTGVEGNDKVYVLEDTDGDGKADKSTVFAEGLLTPTGILPGDGGVYVANSTEILHFTDTDGDGKADKKRRVLSGFGTADTHHLIHTFRWGPEGRLYFNQSIYIYSHVETPSGIKRLEGGGVWQLRPESLELDVYAKGLINPWGLQFNRWGQSFLTDGAGTEGINYAFPGATFVTSPGAERIIRGLNPGQPKHCGLEVVSGRHLPDSWSGSIITNDFRANRVNRFKIEEQGSGYASKQAEDLLWTDDVAFRPVDISVGPDGAIYVADWYNPIIQHGEVDFYDPRRDQQRGRIWRIVAKDRPLVKPPALSEATVNEILDALKLPEDWTRAQAKQVLKRQGADKVMPALQKWISGLDKKDPDHEHHLLEALWVHQTFDIVNEQLLQGLLNAKSHNARAAGLRVLQSWHNRIADTPVLLKKAAADDHPRVRLEAVIALRKLQTAEAARTALSILEHPMDEFLDYSLWQTLHGLEPLLMKRLKTEPDFFGDSRKTAFALKSMNNADATSLLMQLYRNGQVPEEYHRDVLQATARSGETAELSILFDMAVQGYKMKSKEVAGQLEALTEAARRRDIKPNKNLHRIAEFIASEDEAIAVSALRLIGYWRIEEMNDRLIERARNGNKDVKRAALQALANNNAGQVLRELAGGKSPVELRLLATAQLVPLNVTEAARLGVELLRRLPQTEDASELFKAFLSHQEGARALGEELMANKIPENIARAVRPAFQRQIPWGRHKNDDVRLLIQALEASGGFLPAERMPQQLTRREINNLAVEINGAADHQLGEAVFRKSNCVSCHAIGGAGGLMGPDLSSLGTSSTVENIIRSMLYPAESIKEGYELQRVTKKDGAELTGYMVSNAASEVVMRDLSGKEVSLDKSQIAELEKVPGSLMPPGLTAGLEKEEFINLVGFLSKLGESGKFRVPNTRFVRRWKALLAGNELSQKIREEGLEYILNENTKGSLRPVYSKVSGDLPIEELPVVEVGSNRQYSFVTFEVEVLSAGNLGLSLNSAEGITAWVGDEQRNLTDPLVHLAAGIHEITLAIDRRIRRDGVLGVQLQEAEHSPAQTRLVMGQ